MSTNQIPAPAEFGYEGEYRPTLLTDRIDSAHSVRTALKQISRSRDDIFEVRNLLRVEDEKLRQYEADVTPCLSMQEDELQKANAAALKAAEEVVKAQAVLHRNMMTLLGFRTDAETPHEW